MMLLAFCLQNYFNNTLLSRTKTDNIIIIIIMLGAYISTDISQQMYSQQINIYSLLC